MPTDFLENSSAAVADCPAMSVDIINIRTTNQLSWAINYPVSGLFLEFEWFPKLENSPSAWIGSVNVCGERFDRFMAD